MIQRKHSHSDTSQTIRPSFFFLLVCRAAGVFKHLSQTFACIWFHNYILARVNAQINKLNKEQITQDKKLKKKKKTWTWTIYADFFPVTCSLEETERHYLWISQLPVTRKGIKAVEERRGGAGAEMRGGELQRWTQSSHRYEAQTTGQSPHRLHKKERGQNWEHTHNIHSAGGPSCQYCQQ